METKLSTIIAVVSECGIPVCTRFVKKMGCVSSFDLNAFTVSNQTE